MSDNIKNKVKSQFGQAAESYATSAVHAKGEGLSTLAELITPQADWQALDVATGAGHTALLFAPHVAQMIASDLTEPMLNKTAELAEQRGVTNVETRQADAETLPFDDAAFDLVTCRLGLHHFPNARQAIHEFARVLKPHGLLGFTDNVTVPDKKAAGYYNAYEKLRDPSHNWAYPAERLQAMFEQAGLHVQATRRLSKELEFHEWADRMRVSDGDKEKLQTMMTNLPDSLRPLFQPRWADETMYFSLWEWVCVAVKAG